MRFGRLWWSWVQLPDRCFGVLVLVWFCVFLFLFWSWVQNKEGDNRPVVCLISGLSYPDRGFRRDSAPSTAPPTAPSTAPSTAPLPHHLPHHYRSITAPSTAPLPHHCRTIRRTIPAPSPHHFRTTCGSRVRSPLKKNDRPTGGVFLSIFLK